MDGLEAVERALGELLGHRPRRGASTQLRRLLTQLETTRGLSAPEVAARICWDLPLAGQLVHAITVDETFFFRYPEHFEFLVQRLQHASPTPERPALCWSLGCASGEEAYTMAMAIDRVLGPEMLRAVRIVGIDVDSNALSRARQGIYRAWSFRGTDASLRARYFEEVGDGAHRVIQRIRQAVTFQHAELRRHVLSATPATVDIAFFRNVSIYLTPETLTAVHAGLARALRSGGALVLGPGDPLPADPRFGEASIAIGFVPRLPRGPLTASTAKLGPSSTARAPRASTPRPTPASPRSATGQLARLRPADDTTIESSIEELSPTESGSPPAIEQALRLADAGQLPRAVEVLDGWLARSSQSAEGLGLRGCLHLALANTQQGVADLRSALYLRPSDAWLRYQYALGLHALGRDRAAHSQVTAALSSIADSDDTERLSGADITAGALRHAGQEFLRRLA